MGGVRNNPPCGNAGSIRKQAAWGQGRAYRLRKCRFFRSPLEFFAKVFKHQVAEKRRDQRDCEVRRGQDVHQGESQRLALSIRNSEFSHQQVRVKQKNYKCHLDHRPPKPGEAPSICTLLLHVRPILTRIKHAFFALTRGIDSRDGTVQLEIRSSAIPAGHRFDSPGRGQ